ncbi:putative radial spoke protein 7 [Monocercomonoides exilis]|uniref:putative radial spoke protein 7 n=1 Tax=Monocercomonoides exilis TaxID=2049356 RepID=UPI003559BE19|nr:putative radial spoke protein 7 [Monocercomonoides exilis]|eukprot:MONOS_4480.1-p1 / transcript=MONOS_4480.1 / gene=MONOS_4480 / organism=Monocercomonoides_exilis_PA203 / gene_product=radial spoke protein 7 / transcript_product=radial spoke protein 7 / location=Mono_scaffold00119:93567-95290(-) / protein_length=414 / sequence_SO=supercontig / SO=protein_coding / is_pseudo=false
MSSKYATAQKIPEGLPELLKDFAREVLRKQPVNIYAFGAKYFKELLEYQSTSPFAAISEQVQEMLESTDSSHSGVVTFEQFKNILFDESLNLPERLSQMALIEQSINDDGTCSYQGFLEILTPCLDAANLVQPNIHGEEQPRIHIHGLIRDEFEQTLSLKLQEFQACGAGEIERAAIRKALQDQELGLTRKEINLSMGYIEQQYPDGTFDYAELASNLYELLFHSHEENFLSLPMDKDSARDALIRAFQEAAPEGVQELHALDIESILFSCDLGFTELQTHAIIGVLADLTVDVDFVAFASYIAGWVAQFEQGTDLREVGPTVAGMEREALQEHLLSEFKKVDTSDTGYLPYTTIAEIISQLPFSPREKSAVLSFALPSMSDEEGVPYIVIVQNVVNVCFMQTRLALDLVESEQ